MCDAMVHRGPDGQGTFVEGSLALGMRRLSVIDVAGGGQPIANENGSIQVVFNGEIYNFRALRAELERAGHTFRTQSDTETIVHGYEEWGDDVLCHFRGMFAIALWDRPRQRLFLARDRFGIKPLYLWLHDGGLAFASELKSLTLLDGFPTELDTTALLRYLALGYVPDPLCIWKGVRKLAPGHLVVWERDQEPVGEEWWSPLVPAQSGITETEAREEIGVGKQASRHRSSINRTSTGMRLALTSQINGLARQKLELAAGSREPKHLMTPPEVKGQALNPGRNPIQ